MASNPKSPYVRSYRDLKVWRVGMDLVIECYRSTDPFPDRERYGLTQQIRRAAISIPSNVAEGSGRNHLGEYLYHLSVANGSLMELETQLLISQRLGYLPEEATQQLLNKCATLGKMVAGLTRKLSRRKR